VIAGSITSSIKYNNLNDGNAIDININAGVTVHINSINVPCTKYLCDITLLLFAKSFKIKIIIHATPTAIKLK
jgi:hypothetical protein